jgi:hypothetical protein
MACVHSLCHPCGGGELDAKASAPEIEGTTMAIVKNKLTNEAFGFPRGKRRRIDPIALACIHITGNNRTSKMDKENPGSGNAAEFQFANRANSNGPSAHLYVARDGSAIEAIPGFFAAWSNGDVSDPRTSNAGVAKVVAFRKKGYNANEAYWEEIECVGGSKFRITDAQIETCARRIARRSARSGIAISRDTVHGHFEINGVDRQNDPAPKSKHDDVMRKIVTMAKEFAGNPPVDPTPQPHVDPPAEPLALRFGATAAIQGDFVVTVAKARRRSSPSITDDNIFPRRLLRGDHFHVGQTTESGGLVGGSRRWHGNNAGTVWMHSSVLRRS